MISTNKTNPIILLLIIFALFTQSLAFIVFVSLTGRVTDKNGNGVAGAIVLADKLGSNYVKATRTNNNGFYRFNNLPAGRYRIIVENPKGENYEKRVGLAPGQSLRLNFEVQSSENLIAEADDSFKESGNDQSIENLPDRPRVSNSKKALKTSRLKLDKDQTLIKTISGRVIDKNGKPIANAIVRLKNLNTGISKDYKTDDDGRYLIQVSDSGKYSLKVTAKGFGDKNKNIKIKPIKEKNFKLKKLD